MVLVFWTGSDVALTDVTVYAGPGNATIFHHISGAVTVDGFQVRRHPGTDRLLSTGADALHFNDVPAKISITRCAIDGMGDDAINIYTQGNTVSSVQGETTLTFQPTATGIAAGHTLQVVDLATATVRGIAKIASYSLGADGKTVTLVLDRPVAGLRSDDTLYDVDLFVVGPYPSGTYLTSVMADALRETGVGAACGTASSRHGFFVPLTAAMRKTHAGKTIFVHAIDEPGNPLLHNSGVFVIS
jgi:hypothetical protein